MNFLLEASSEISGLKKRKSSVGLSDGGSKARPPAATDINSEEERERERERFTKECALLFLKLSALIAARLFQENSFSDRGW